jgi:hypothetical protein
MRRACRRSMASLASQLLVQGVILDTNVLLKATGDEPRRPDEVQFEQTPTLMDDVMKLSVKELRMQQREWNENEWLGERELRLKTLARWEKEDRVPGREQQEQIMQLYESHADDLLNSDDPAVVREKYMRRLADMKHANAIKPQNPPEPSVAAGASAEASSAERVDPKKYPWTMRQNGSFHAAKYLRSRGLLAALMLQPDMHPHIQIHGFVRDHYDHVGHRPPEDSEATVGDLRLCLSELVEGMGIERHNVMVVSDCRRMLQAAKRQDMHVCAYEPSGQQLDSFFHHRIERMSNLRHEIEMLNGVSHLANQSGANIPGPAWLRGK